MRSLGLVDVVRVILNDGSGGRLFIPGSLLLWRGEQSTSLLGLLLLLQSQCLDLRGGLNLCLKLGLELQLLLVVVLLHGHHGHRLRLEWRDGKEGKGGNHVAVSELEQ